MTEKQQPKVETFTMKNGAQIRWNGKGLCRRTVTVVWEKIDTVEEEHKATIRYFPKQPVK